jgi:hypothetical protein
MKKLLLIAATAIAALVLSAQALAAAQPKFITDTLAPGGTAVPQQVQGYRFITDTLAPGGGTTTAPVGSPGFDWSDAGVGALTAVGVVLVLAGAALTAVRRRTVVTS